MAYDMIMEVSLHFKNLFPWDINNWQLFTDSKVRSRNRDPDLSDFFSNIPGIVLNQLLMLKLIHNIKNTGLAKYYLANAIWPIVKTQFLESDKLSLNPGSSAYLNSANLSFHIWKDR